MSAPHARTPWYAHHLASDEVYDADNRWVCECKGEDAANAAFIVQACNAHVGLVAALKLALPVLLTADDDAVPRLAERISAAEEALRMTGAIR